MGVLWGWLLLIPIGLSVLLARTDAVEPPIRLRLALYVGGQLLAAGLLASALVDGWRRLPWRKADYLVLALSVALLAWWTLPDDLQVIIGRLPTFLPRKAWLGVMVASAAGGVALLAWFGRLCARPWLRWLAVFGGLALGLLNHRFALDDYPGVHLMVAVCAATLAGSALAQRPALPVKRASWPRHLARLLAALPAAYALVVPPTNTIGVHLYRGSTAVLAPWASRLQQLVPKQERVAFTPKNSRWYTPRANAPAVPPSDAELLPDNGIVILFVIDTTRADVLDGRFTKRLPTLSRLKETGVYFHEAISPAPATAQAVGAIMSGRYYSQLEWQKRSGRPYCYPDHDKSPRLPELLQRGGVHTASRTGLPGLASGFGILRGVEDEQILKRRGRHTPMSSYVVPAAIERLSKVKDEPLFLYVHMDDPHAPYTSGKGGKTQFERYVAEIAEADKRLGQLLAALKKHKLEDRTLLIVTADHGEAFGEHGARHHATTLYQELLRIPLIFSHPALEARHIEQRVSLIDLAPTILDLYHQPTPGTFMGQSLVPLLRGKDTALSRPLVADSARLKRAMIFEDGKKLIVDSRTGVRELYDLEQDPEELENRYDTDPESPIYDQLLSDFFEAHELKKPGYETHFCR